MAQRNMPDDIQRVALQSYPGMVQQHFDEMMETTFPDRTREDEAPFEAVESTVADGTYILVNPDPLAPPYVRVTVREPDGGESTFSVSRQFVDGILGQEQASGDLLLTSLTSFPFRLPETVRASFADLSREALTETVMKQPELQQQEIVRMPRFYRERAEEVLRGLSNAVSHTARPRRSSAAAGPGFGPGAGQRGSAEAPAIVRRPAPRMEAGAAHGQAGRGTPNPRRWFWPALGAGAAAVVAGVMSRRRTPRS
jgi:hypothetical protein